MDKGESRGVRLLRASDADRDLHIVERADSRRTLCGIKLRSPACLPYVMLRHLPMHQGYARVCPQCQERSDG